MLNKIRSLGYTTTGQQLYITKNRQYAEKTHTQNPMKHIHSNKKKGGVIWEGFFFCVLGFVFGVFLGGSGGEFGDVFLEVLGGLGEVFERFLEVKHH